MCASKELADKQIDRQHTTLRLLELGVQGVKQKHTVTPAHQERLKKGGEAFAQTHKGQQDWVVEYV